ncbi:acyl-CoA N-acyltransferase [Biscogniauxia mediterranea]|nr:acyl-CoA N-acyltransferase [Biscogniauxia mediterranea]
MSLPTSNANANGQSSIRNFFRPKQPAYAPPPSAPAASQPSQTSSPAPPPPPVTGAPSQPSPSSPSNFPSSSSNSNGNNAPLHPQASICPIEPEHVPALRRITSLLLPVNYPDSFYARLADPLSSGAFSRVVLWRDRDGDDDDDDAVAASAPKVIGGLVCRPEPSPFYPSSPTPLGGTSIFQQQQRAPSSPSAQPNALYIQSLVLLSPYRGLGLAAALLDDVTACAARSEFACEAVYAHVWTDNADGLRWYLARGFRQVEEIKGYYLKLRPDSAWVVRRDIKGGGSGGATSAALGLGQSNNSNASRNGGENGIAAAVVPPPPGTSVTAAAANLKPLSTLAPPPPPPRSGRSGTTTPTGMSYQNTRPETEWNDLPADMHVSRSTATTTTTTSGGGNSNLGVPGGGSGSSSRSSSTGRKKRDRAYPAAAFGS